MAEIVLLRHGTTAWSEAGRHTGRTDVPLTERGEQVAQAAGRVLAGRRFGIVLASPLQRARRTAELAGFAPLLDQDLVERDYGGYEGLTTAEIRERFGPDWTIWDAPTLPGDTPGETAEQVGERVERVLARVRPALDAGENVLLVAHGHSLRILAARWVGWPAREGAHLVLDAGALSTLGVEHDWPAIRAWNVTQTLA